LKVTIREKEIMKPTSSAFCASFHAAAEAMKHAAAFGFAFQDLDSLSFSLARMNHHRQVARARRAKLALESVDLYVTW
jgi:hypothetical protein